jgi:hypothetical protein
MLCAWQFVDTYPVLADVAAGKWDFWLLQCECVFGHHLWYVLVKVIMNALCLQSKTHMRVLLTRAPQCFQLCSAIWRGYQVCPHECTKTSHTSFANQSLARSA